MTNLPDAAALAEVVALLSELLDGPSAGKFYGIDGPLWNKLETIRLATLRAKPSGEVVERCRGCDDTGDIIRADGQWLGYCGCPAGSALRTRPATEGDGLRLALLQTQWLLETIVRSHSTNFKDVSERIIANRASLASEEPTAAKGD